MIIHRDSPEKRHMNSLPTTLECQHCIVSDSVKIALTPPPQLTLLLGKFIYFPFFPDKCLLSTEIIFGASLMHVQ
jgi:hypothetical protein